jgi:hypothetical protein
MTRDDIIRMAQEADPGFEADPHLGESLVGMEAIERFAALVADYEWNRAIGIAKGMQGELQAKFEQTYMQGVIAGAAAEREACAKECEAIATETYGMVNLHEYGECANAIRARGSQG